MALPFEGLRGLGVQGSRLRVQDSRFWMQGSSIQALVQCSRFKGQGCREREREREKGRERRRERERTRERERETHRERH